MAEIVVEGSPDPLERALGRGLRILQVLVAGPATLLLWWLDQWMWLPIPIAASFLVYEAVYSGRRGRVRLALGDDGLRLEDPRRGQTTTLRWDEVDVATASFRAPDDPEAVVMLADRSGPRLGLRLVGEPRPGDVDLGAVDRELGGTGDRLPAVHAVAPIEAVARQAFADPRALAILREKIPAEAWGRAGARVWVGEAPPMDPYGYHQGDPSGWLRFDGDRWAIRRGGEEVEAGALAGASLATRTRPASLRLTPGSATIEVEIRLVVLQLPGGPRVGLPAGTPEAGARPEVDPGPTDLHTHFPEGAALLAYGPARAGGWAAGPHTDTGSGPTRVQGSP